MTAPVLLDAHNFTPPSRTPWGGEKLAQHKRLVQKISVGESWEFSLGPEFPSHLADGRVLADVINKDRATWRGFEATSPNKCELLLKIIDARENLSVQIHPQHDDPALADGESGKPEAWYVIESEPGAGIYLGLRSQANRDVMRAALTNGADVSEFLNFVPVRGGDFFWVMPGTAHAIGAGCLLLEPQGLTHGKKGVTYRYWDWNRRYDREGALHASGSPRALHVERALACTDWQAPRDQAFVDSTRGVANARGVIESPSGLWTQVFREAANAEADGHGSLRAFTAFSEDAVLHWSGGSLSVPSYCSAAVPATLSFSVTARHAVLSAAVAMG